MKDKMLIWESAAFVSGGQRMTLLIIDAMREQYEIMVLAPEEGELTQELRIRNVPYVLVAPQHMNKGHKSLLSIFKYVQMSLVSIRIGIKAAWHFKPKILYAPGPAALPWAAIVGAVLRIPVMWHLHHVFEDNKTCKLLNFVAKFPKRLEVVAVSQVVADQLSVNEPVKVVYNPVDFELYSNGNPDAALVQLRQIDSGAVRRITSHETTIVVGCIGLLQPTKKQNIVVELAERLGRKDTLHYEFLIVGKALEDSLGYAESLAKRASKVEGNAHVTLVGFHRDINNWLKLMDVVIISSIEGFPLVGLEAMAAGIPLLCIDEGGAAELVRVSGAGVLFHGDETAEEMEKKIVQLINSSRYSRLGIDFARETSTDSYASVMGGLFARLINEQ